MRQGLFHVAKLIAAIEDKDSAIPEAARPILSLLIEQLRSLDERLGVLAARLPAALGKMQKPSG